jgi:hypothetical protein
MLGRLSSSISSPYTTYVAAGALGPLAIQNTPNVVLAECDDSDRRLNVGGRLGTRHCRRGSCPSDPPRRAGRVVPRCQPKLPELGQRARVHRGRARWRPLGGTRTFRRSSSFTRNCPHAGCGRIARRGPGADARAILSQVYNDRCSGDVCVPACGRFWPEAPVRGTAAIQPLSGVVRTCLRLCRLDPNAE